jgi:hypothetical protein
VRGQPRRRAQPQAVYEEYAESALSEYDYDVAQPLGVREQTVPVGAHRGRTVIDDFEYPELDDDPNVPRADR